MFGLRVTSLKGRPLTPMMALMSPLVLPQSSSMLVTPLVTICETAGQQRIVVGAAAHQRQPGGLEIGHAGILGVLLDQLVMLHQQHRGEQQPRLLGDLELAHLGSCRGGGERERESNDQPLPANHGRPPRTTACGAVAQSTRMELERPRRKRPCARDRAEAKHAGKWEEDDGGRLAAGSRPDRGGETRGREAGRPARRAPPEVPR